MLPEIVQGKAVTHDDAVEVVTGEHDHAPCPAKYTAQNLIHVAGMRKRATEEVQTVPSIYMDALQSVQRDDEREAVAAQLPTFTSLYTCMYM